VSGSDVDRVRDALRGEQAPRFVSQNVLARMAGGIAPGRIALAGLVVEGALAPAGHGLYANRAARPAVHPKELVPHLAPDAYVSLHTVLGEHGVANNPSRTVYAIRARDAAARAPDVSYAAPLSDYRILSMDRDLMEAGAEEDRLEAGGRHRQATPERALCDWILLSGPSGGKLLTPPPLEFDLDDLDRGRIGRLADAMGIAPAMDAWLARHAAAQADPDFSEQTAPGLGY
jgi:hypothetical protein